MVRNGPGHALSRAFCKAPPQTLRPTTFYLSLFTRLIWIRSSLCRRDSAKVPDSPLPESSVSLYHQEGNNWLSQTAGPNSVHLASLKLTPAESVAGCLIH